jgi:hypothetical protein
LEKKHQKHFTGKVKIKLVSCNGIPGKQIANSDIFVLFKIDGSLKAKSRPSQGKWNDEIIFAVDKAKDFEVSVYEKGGLCLALTWFSFSMLSDQMLINARRKGFVKELENEGEEIRLPRNALSLFGDKLDTTLEMEPTGRIHLKITLGIHIWTWKMCCGF